MTEGRGLSPVKQPASNAPNMYRPCEAFGNETVSTKSLEKPLEINQTLLTDPLEPPTRRNRFLAVPQDREFRRMEGCSFGHQDAGRGGNVRGGHRGAVVQGDGSLPRGARGPTLA